MASTLAMPKGLSMSTPLSFSPSRSFSSSSSSLSLSTRRVSHLSVVRCSNADGPIRRPSPASPSPPSPPPTATSAPVTAVTERPSLSPSAATTAAPQSTAVTIEFQRQKAKEMQSYFQDLKFENQVRDLRVFGWTRKNEITNGRWTMFGFAVGLLTEFATGIWYVSRGRDRTSAGSLTSGRCKLCHEKEKSGTGKPSHSPLLASFNVGVNHGSTVQLVMSTPFCVA